MCSRRATGNSIQRLIVDERGTVDCRHVAGPREDGNAVMLSAFSCPASPCLALVSRRKPDRMSTCTNVSDAASRNFGCILFERHSKLNGVCRLYHVQLGQYLCPFLL